MAIIAVEGYMYLKTVKYNKEPVPEAISFEDIVKEAKSDSFEAIDFGDANAVDVEEVKEVSLVALPNELNLQAAFYPQAPFANWGYPWQEACEEASVLLVVNEYFKHEWTREEFNQEILDLVAWENEYFGSYEHTNVDQTAEMLDVKLGLKSIIHENPTYEDVKRTLAKGHLIVMTFAGKKIGNPFYTNGGPMYHAMVIKGYKEGEKVITHDVGTKRGEDYVYSWAVIDGAMRDYAEPIESGAKRMIEVLPPGVQPSLQPVTYSF